MPHSLKGSKKLYKHSAHIIGQPQKNNQKLFLKKCVYSNTQFSWLWRDLIHEWQTLTVRRIRLCRRLYTGDSTLSYAAIAAAVAAAAAAAAAGTASPTMNHWESAMQRIRADWTSALPFNTRLTARLLYFLSSFCVDTAAPKRTLKTGLLHFHAKTDLRRWKHIGQLWI